MNKRPRRAHALSLSTRCLDLARRSLPILAAVAAASLHVGCADESTSDAADPSLAPPGPDLNGTPPGGKGEFLPCDVEKVLAESCRSCHGATPAYGAPMPLVTYADLVAPSRKDKARKTYEAVEARIHDRAHMMPPLPAAPLDAAAAASIDRWVAAGAPPASVSCGAGGATPPGTADPEPLPCTPDTHIRPGTPAIIDPVQEDQYWCYGFDVTVAQKRHIIGFGPQIDNKALVHHLLLFQVPEAVSPTPARCGAGSAGGRLIGGWAPGGRNRMLPLEAGIPEEGTTHYMMQVHYNNGARLSGQTDSSGFDMCTTDELRPNDADVMALGSVLGVSIDPHSKLDLVCDTQFTFAEKIHIFGASPHMHRLGRAMSSENLNGPSGPEMIVDQPSFDFNAQVGFAANNDVENGDVLRTHCVWENNSANQVTFGEGTSDEMCFNFLAYYPKITAPFWSWITPSLMTSCQRQ